MLVDINPDEWRCKACDNLMSEPCRHCKAIKAVVRPVDTIAPTEGAAETVKIYETYSGQNGWLEVSQEEYDRTKDKYEHRIRRVPAPSPEAPAVNAPPVEVWHGDRKVTVYADSVLRIWGAHIEDEMSDAPRTLQSVQEAMDWLYADPKPAVDALTTGAEPIYQRNVDKSLWVDISRKEFESAIRNKHKYGIRTLYAHPASEPKALTLTDEHRKAISRAIALLWISHRIESTETIDVLRALLADRGSEGK